VGAATPAAETSIAWAEADNDDAEEKGTLKAAAFVVGALPWVTPLNSIDVGADEAALRGNGSDRIDVAAIDGEGKVDDGAEVIGVPLPRPIPPTTTAVPSGAPVNFVWSNVRVW
jgi:hypothetical protein